MSFDQTMSYFLDFEPDEDLVRRTGTSRLKPTIQSDSESEAELSAIDSDVSLELPIQKPPKKKSKKLSLDTQVENERAQGEKWQNITSGSSKVLEEIKKTNKILCNLTNRVKRTEKRIKVIEDQVSNCSSSSTDFQVTPKKKKADVPDEVRVSRNAFYFISRWDRFLFLIGLMLMQSNYTLLEALNVYS